MSSKAGHRGGGHSPYPKGGHSKSKMLHKQGGGIRKQPGKVGAEGKEGKKRTSQRDRIRLLQHLLKKEDLTSAAREAAQRELDELLAAQAKAKQAEKERKLATRYHHVRFFERVKIERHIAHLQKSAAPEGPGLTVQQQQELAQWQADLQYVRYFPPGEKYVSVLKNASNPEDQAKLDAERQRLRGLVAQRVQAAAQAAADAAALTEVDEGRQVAALHQEAVAAATAAAAAAASTHKKGPAASMAAVASKPAAKQAAKAATATRPLTGVSSKPAVASPAAVLASEDLDNDDEFFLSEDEEVPVPGVGVGVTAGQSDRGVGSRAAGLVAQAWQRPSHEAESDDDSQGDQDVGDESQDGVDGQVQPADGALQQTHTGRHMHAAGTKRSGAGEGEGDDDEEEGHGEGQGAGHRPGGKHKPRHMKRRKLPEQQRGTSAQKPGSMLQKQEQKQHPQQRQQQHHAAGSNQEDKKRRRRRRNKDKE